MVVGDPEVATDGADSGTEVFDSVRGDAELRGKMHLLVIVQSLLGIALAQTMSMMHELPFQHQKWLNTITKPSNSTESGRICTLFLSCTTEFRQS